MPKKYNDTSISAVLSSALCAQVAHQNDKYEFYVDFYIWQTRLWRNGIYTSWLQRWGGCALLPRWSLPQHVAHADHQDGNAEKLNYVKLKDEGWTHLKDDNAGISLYMSSVTHFIGSALTGFQQDSHWSWLEFKTQLFFHELPCFLEQDFPIS